MQRRSVKYKRKAASMAAEEESESRRREESNRRHLSISGGWRNKHLNEAAKEENNGWARQAQWRGASWRRNHQHLKA